MTSVIVDRSETSITSITQDFIASLLSSSGSDRKNEHLFALVASCDCLGHDSSFAGSNNCTTSYWPNNTICSLNKILVLSAQCDVLNKQRSKQEVSNLSDHFSQNKLFLPGRLLRATKIRLVVNAK